MKHLRLACAVLIAGTSAGPLSAQVAGTGTASASVVDATAIGVPAAPSVLSRFQPAFDVAAFLIDAASGAVSLPKGGAAVAGSATGSPDAAAPQVTVQRNADGSVSFAVTGGGNLGYAFTRTPSGAVSVDYN